MTGSVRSVGPSSRYTVLAANVSKVLTSLADRTISETEQKLIARAADLLRTIVQGTKFVERKDAHALAKPQESLFTASHALSALQKLDDADENAKQVTEIFEELEGDLRALAAGAQLERKRLEMISRFFDILGDIFYRDVANSSVVHRHPHFERP